MGNRVIKFRGKRRDNGEWVHGNFVLYEHMGEVKHIIVTDWAQVYVNSHYVIPKTVGQYTGLDDRNGVEIYEGDIITTDLMKICKATGTVIEIDEFGVDVRRAGR